MSKRELIAVEANGDEVRRAKRRKDGSGSSIPVDDIEMSDGEDNVDHNGNSSDGLSKEAVKEHGLRVWQIVKDAVGKDGRILSPDFLRLPSKRQYADYYIQTKRPIALDDIKKQLDTESYKSLEEVRRDFDTCFKNAKKYNMRESQIWKDAKALHKIAGKEFDKVMSPDDEEVDIEGDASDDGGSKKKRSKAPNMTRLLKSRMQKLINKQDENGRLLSDVFMDLPSKKKWPIYYKTIKRPICLEDIFRKIRRKEYETVSDCVADVDLVFSNALQFNEDHTQIWEDAIILRDYFHKLMKDLPPPYGSPADAGRSATDKPTTGLNKIVLKVPANPANAAKAAARETVTTTPKDSTTNTSKTTTVALADKSNTTTLSPTIAKAKIKSPLVAHAAVPSTSQTPLTTTSANVAPAVPAKPIPSIQPSTPKQQSVQPRPQPQPQPQLQPPTQPQTPAPASTLLNTTSAALFNYANYQSMQNYYPTQTAMSTPVARPATTAVSTVANTRANISNITPPALNNAWPIRFVRLATQPLGRKLELDQREGVRSWAMRLTDGERKIILSNIKFAIEVSEAEDDSDDEKDGEKDADEEGAAVKETAGPKKGRRGRKKAIVTPPLKEKEKEQVNGKPKAKADSNLPKQPPPIEDILVKLDGSQVKLDADKPGEWIIEVSVGSHVVELGHKTGMMWKVYIDRRS